MVYIVGLGPGNRDYILKKAIDILNKSDVIIGFERLIKNLDKYIIEEEKGTFKINQSIAIQDSVNMAVALFNDMEFRAVSGKDRC